MTRQRLREIKFPTVDLRRASMRAGPLKVKVAVGEVDEVARRIDAALPS